MKQMFLVTIVDILQETYSKPKYEKLGVTVDFVQDNMSFSAQKGTLRGLHWQNPPYAQSKLVSCTKGKVIDVAVDIRKGSPTYGKWVSVELSAEKSPFNSLFLKVLHMDF